VLLVILVLNNSVFGIPSESELEPHSEKIGGVGHVY